MNELVQIKKNDVYTNSLIIADGTGIAHRKIKDAIKKYKSAIEKLGLLASYQAESTGGRPEELYLLNEQQATFLITLLKNTDVVVDFKLELVRQFYSMRKLILEKQTAEWQLSRTQSKFTRKTETDIIKQLVEYAKAQGSTHADMLYMTYSKLTNNAVGISSRETATTEQLQNLRIVENIVAHVVADGINQQLPYKDVYKLCKAKLDMFLQVSYINYNYTLNPIQAPVTANTYYN